MPDYINPNGYTVHLTGPDGRVIRVKSRQTVTLPAFYEKYRSRGIIKLTSEVNQFAPQTKNLPPIPQQIPKQILKRTTRQQIAPPQIERKEENKPITRIDRTLAQRQDRPLVGRSLRGDPTNTFKETVAQDTFPVSNEIGVGILSYNRSESLRRCVSSIMTNTDLDKTTVFISDDNSSCEKVKELLRQYEQTGKFVVLHNNERLGIAGNTNRLLRCLSRFNNIILLNDDVEVLKHGWDSFYFNAMDDTGYKHFIHRQVGIYGATSGSEIKVGRTTLLRTDDKPQGAILAFTADCVDKVGYFDEKFGLYGMEHVDWSTKVYEMGMQNVGFYDIKGSSEYFTLHNEASAVESRGEHLKFAKELFASRIPKKCVPSQRTEVPGISVVVPYRELQRNDSLVTVLSNLKALKYPEIEIILAEQDDESKTKCLKLDRIKKLLVKNGRLPLFNKSMAFNTGVAASKFDKILLHDADILAVGRYLQSVCHILDHAPACHIGKTVTYATENSTQLINIHKSVGVPECERVVGYFEGGSLAANKDAYWAIGGFNEDFYGYGCEDCEFFARLASLTNFVNERTYGFLHLWHPRADNWHTHHNANKSLERSLCILPMQDRINKQTNQIEKYLR
jgi:GT2 family glycosyltransferase